MLGNSNPELCCQLCHGDTFGRRMCVIFFKYLREFGDAFSKVSGKFRLMTSPNDQIHPNELLGLLRTPRQPQISPRWVEKEMSPKDGSAPDGLRCLLLNRKLMIHMFISA